MSTRKEHLDGMAAGLLLVCCMFWGFQQVLVKATLPELPPVETTGGRSTAAFAPANASWGVSLEEAAKSALRIKSP